MGLSDRHWRRVAMDPRVKPEDDGIQTRPRLLNNRVDDDLGDHPPLLPITATVDVAGPAGHNISMSGYVYIVTNQKNGTLYIGVTSDLEERIYQHREGQTPGFAWKYGCTRLVWYEEHGNIGSAIQREKSLKRWLRQWKIRLIEEMNPDWRDLYEELW